MKELKLLQPVLGFVLILIVIPEESALRVYSRPEDFYGELWFNGPKVYLLARNSGNATVTMSAADVLTQVHLPDGSRKALMGQNVGEIVGHTNTIIEPAHGVSLLTREPLLMGGKSVRPKGIRILTAAEEQRWAGATIGICVLAVILAWVLAHYAESRAAGIQDESG